jgi:hypothetical protein
MTTTPDTSPENVARVAEGLLNSYQEAAADMLEALAAERDKLNMRAANAERMLTAAEAKLAASEARVERLREALREERNKALREAAGLLEVRAGQLWEEMGGMRAGDSAYKRMEQRRYECLQRRDEIRALIQEEKE